MDAGETVRYIKPLGQTIGSLVKPTWRQSSWNSLPGIPRRQLPPPR